MCSNLSFAAGSTLCDRPVRRNERIYFSLVCGPEAAPRAMLPDAIGVTFFTRHNPLPPFAVGRLLVQTNGDESMRAAARLQRSPRRRRKYAPFSDFQRKFRLRQINSLILGLEPLTGRFGEIASHYRLKL